LSSTHNKCSTVRWTQY